MGLVGPEACSSGPLMFLSVATVGNNHPILSIHPIDGFPLAWGQGFGISQDVVMIPLPTLSSCRCIDPVAYRSGI
ncbi:hypothetical protein ASPCADRAFT_206149, partial [Aspergillus carbonarius ITEM 5010]